jgi:hypothetical protein
MSDYTPIFGDNDQMTFTAGSAIAGGQLVSISADNTVIPSPAASLAVVGVAAFDAATGARVSVYARDTVHETVVGTAGDVVAGDPVEAGATVLGTIAKSTTPAIAKTIGTCVKGATATNKARWIGF